MIYIIKHREYDNPIPKDYIELNVGNRYENIYDDNINNLNLQLNEITGLYDIWKHTKDDIVGLCHYRRFFWYNDDYLKLSDAKEILKDYDIIVTKDVTFDMTLYWQLRFEVEDSDALDKYLNEYYKVVPGFKDFLNKKSFHNREMFVCKRKLMNKYCEWLFPIVIPIAEKFIIEDLGTNINQRLVSHIAERLFAYWVESNNLKTYRMDYKDI